MQSDNDLPTVTCERCGSDREVKHFVRVVADGGEVESTTHALCRACLAEQVRHECEEQVSSAIRTMRELPPGTERNWEPWAQALSASLCEQAAEWGFTLSDRASAFVERYRGV